MLSYKFVAASVGAIVAVTVAVVLTYPFAQSDDVKCSKAAKLDVSYTPANPMRNARRSHGLMDASGIQPI